MSDETRAAERPATFRDVFASREFRFLYSAQALSWMGDYLARAAVTALVLVETKSIALSASAFALSFLPWAVGGPVLAAIAERYRFRPMMISCDLIRATMMLLLAIPGTPVPVMLALLFLTALANPPSEAARSAMLPQILVGDRYVVGLSVQKSTSQAAQLVGYLVGASMAPFYPRLALLLNAGTFLISALLIRIGVGDRRPIGLDLPVTGAETAASNGRRRPATHRRRPKEHGAAATQRHLLRETADGFRLVFGRPVLRAIALLVFASMLFAIVPEGLAAGWAQQVAPESHRGWAQGAIMISEPVGFIFGGLAIGRLVGPETRLRLIRPLAMLAPAALVPALFNPSVAVIALLGFGCGFAIAGLMPPTNGLFVQALPAGYRARAFGVMQAGVQIMQGVAVLITGALAEHIAIPRVVGLWSLAGVLLIGVISVRWPSREMIADAVATAQAANEAAAKAERTAPPTIPSPSTRHTTGPLEASV